MRNKITILHLVNIAGVAGLLAKLHDREFSEHYKGYKAKFIVRKEQDYFGFNEYYRGCGRSHPGNSKSNWGD